MTKIVLSIPNDYKVPAFYETADRNTVALALTLGAKAFEAVESEAIAKVRGETHAEAVKAAVAEAVAGWEATTAALKKEKRRLEESLEVTKARLEALDGAVALQRTAIQKETRESMSEVLAAKDDQIRRLQGLLDSQMGGLATKFESLQTSLTKTFTSSKEKGSVGEVLVEQFIKKAYDLSLIHI